MFSWAGQDGAPCTLCLWVASARQDCFMDCQLPQSPATLVPAAVAFCSFDRGMCSSKEYGRVLLLDPQDQRCSARSAGLVYLFQMCWAAEEQSYGHE